MTTTPHLFLTHPTFLEHGRLDHPENARRLQAIYEAFERSPYRSLLRTDLHRKATLSELATVHTETYIRQVLALEGKEGALDVETLLTPKSVEAALLAAGLAIELVEQVVQGKVANGFALLRPPGHHARPMAGMGFCLFNNITIAAQHALGLGVQKILILDFDVHHGNGTQEAFYADRRVLFVDMHQDNLFPNPSGSLAESGSGPGLGYTINLPLPPDRRDSDYLKLLDKVVTPLFFEFQPELILVSAGFDAHESDPLGHMKLTTEGYSAMTAFVRHMASQMGHQKIAYFLEGGYDPYWLAQNVIACVEQLTLETPKRINLPERDDPSTDRLIEKYYDFHITHSRRTTG